MKTRVLRSVGSCVAWRRRCLLRLEGLEGRTQPGSLLLFGLSPDLLGAAPDLGVPAADANTGVNSFPSLPSDLSADLVLTAPLPLGGDSAPAQIPTPAVSFSSADGSPRSEAGLDVGFGASAPSAALASVPATGATPGGALAVATLVGAPPSLAAVVPSEPTAAVGAGPVTAALTGGPRPTSTSAAGTPAFGSHPSQLPLSFEANQGQTDAQVQFLARGAGYTLFLTPTAAVFNLPVPATAAAGGTSATASGMTEALRMDLLRANPAAAATSEDPLPGKINYLLGNDPVHWHVNIPTFGRVAYQGVYPGIDLAYYGHQGQLEYDFVVHPGADPHAVRLGFEGADHVSLDSQGDLMLTTAAGPLVQPAPVVYQEVNGIRHAVAGRFVLEGAGQLGFALGAYDPMQPLVIDPVVVTYSTYLGGSGPDIAYGVAVDSGDHAYVAGQALSPDFPTTPGAFQTSLHNIAGNAYVTELTADGSGLVYSTYLGGTGTGFFPDGDEAIAVAVDAAGHAYVTGDTEVRDFPTTPGAFQTTYGGIRDAFVTELTADGSGLVYSTYLGGSRAERGFSIAVDAAGHAYLTGYTSSANFPTTPGAFQTSLGGAASKPFVTELTADGSGLVYSTYLGGSRADTGGAIAVDAAGHAYVTGTTDSPDFPTTPGAFQTTLHFSNGNAFVTELTADGSGLVYSTYLGGTGNTPTNSADEGSDIAVDAAGHAYVAGLAFSSDFPTTPGAFQTTTGNPNGGNGFVAELTPDGSGLVYSTYLGGSGGGYDTSDYANSIAVDATGRAYVTGTTFSTDFPTTPGAFQTTKGGLFSAFVTVFTPDGAHLAYSTYLGGSGSNDGSGIALAADGSVYATGITDSRDFPTTPGAFQPTLPGGLDGWVVSGRLM